jgi:hypothetical protein
MPIEIEAPNGEIVEFPDGTPDAEIERAMQDAYGVGGVPGRLGGKPQRNRPRSNNPAGRRPGAGGVTPDYLPPEGKAPAPMPLGRRVSREEAMQDAGQRAAMRYQQRGMGMPGLGMVTQPFVNTLSDPARREEFGRSFANTARGVSRDLQALPSLDLGQLASDTMTAGGEAVRNLPETANTIATHLPELARAITVGPILDEEDAQRRLDYARARGDAGGVTEAAREANEQTGLNALNTVGFGAGAAVRTPAQAAMLSAGLTAPGAFSRNGDQPLQERLPQALVDTGGAAMFGAGLQAAPGVVLRGIDAAQRLPVPTPRRTLERFERAGVDPSVAALEGGGISGAVQKVIGDNWLGGGNVRNRTQRQASQVMDATRRIEQGYGRARTPEGAGRVVQGAVQRYATDRNVPNPLPEVPPRNVSTRNWSFAAKAGALYDSALEPIIDNPATLTHTMTALDELSQRSSNPAVRQFTTSPTLRRFEMLARRRAVREIALSLLWLMTWRRSSPKSRRRAGRRLDAASKR